jgi:hypothetical protein
MTRAWARLCWGAEARVKVTPDSVQFGTGLPTGALANERTISPAAFFCGFGSAAGAVAGEVAAGAAVAAAFARMVAGGVTTVLTATTNVRARELIRTVVIWSTLADGVEVVGDAQAISRPRIVPVPEANEFSGIPMRWRTETNRLGRG